MLVEEFRDIEHGLKLLKPTLNNMTDKFIVDVLIVHMATLNDGGVPYGLAIAAWQSVGGHFVADGNGFPIPSPGNEWFNWFGQFIATSLAPFAVRRPGCFNPPLSLGVCQKSAGA